MIECTRCSCRFHVCCQTFSEMANRVAVQQVQLVFNFYNCLCTFDQLHFFEYINFFPSDKASLIDRDNCVWQNTIIRAGRTLCSTQYRADWRAVCNWQMSCRLDTLYWGRTNYCRKKLSCEKQQSGVKFRPPDRKFQKNFGDHFSLDQFFRDRSHNALLSMSDIESTMSMFSLGIVSLYLYWFCDEWACAP